MITNVVQTVVSCLRRTFCPHKELTPLSNYQYFGEGHHVIHATADGAMIPMTVFDNGNFHTVSEILKFINSDANEIKFLFEDGEEHVLSACCKLI